MEKIACIYSISFGESSKLYIGSSINFGKRKNSHLSDLRRGKHSNIYLQNAFNKYGEQNTFFKIIENLEGSAKTFIIEREQFFIDSLNCLDREYGYNLARKAGSNEGTGNSIESKRKKQSEFMKGKKYALGSKRTPEHIEWQRSSQTGRKLSKEAILNLSKSKKGCVISIEHRLKISLALTGKPLSENTKEKIRRAHAVFSEEDIRNIRTSRSNGISCTKISEIHKCTPTTIYRICSFQRYGWVT